MQNKEHIARQGGRNDSHDHRCRCQRSSSKIAVETSGSLEVPERHGAPTQWMSGWMDTVQGWLRWLREGGGHIEVETVGFWGEQRHLKWWGLEAQSTAGASPSDKLPLGCLPAARVCLPRYCGSPSSFPPGSDCALAGWLAGRDSPPRERAEVVSLQRGGPPRCCARWFYFYSGWHDTKGTGTGEKEALRVGRRPGQPVARKTSRGDGELRVIALQTLAEH